MMYLLYPKTQIGLFALVILISKITTSLSQSHIVLEILMGVELKIMSVMQDQ